MSGIFLFLICAFFPFTTARFSKLEDVDTARKERLNKLMALNTFIFFAPLLLVVILGGGKDSCAALWLYLPILPGCFIMQLVLVSNKRRYAAEKKKVDSEQ